MNLQKFTNKEFGEIRTLEKDNEVWFVGRDIADILQYKETHKAISRLVDEDDRMKYPVKDSLGRMQDTWLINESGLYSLILNSKLETAKKFKKWVTSDILPSIRQHGAYMTPETIEKTLTDPDFLIKLASSLKEEQEKRRLAEAELEETRPKAIFADSVQIQKVLFL